MRRSASTRRALTLVEVILVLALLVVIGAVSAPLLEGSFSRAGLNSAGDLVRAAWAKARLAAMQTGQVYAFRFEPNGSRFQIAALADIGLPEFSAPPTAVAAASNAAVDILRLPQTQLPDGVVFTSGDFSTSAEQQATAPGAADSGWAGPILFHPDGTTSDASILISNSRQTMRVTLRGLTGVSNSSEVDAEAPP